jgi:hypothetical protein
MRPTASDWRYASTGGTAFPVQPREVWRADHHLLVCGDLEAGDGLALLERFGQAPHLVYCDPPWNNGNAAAFRTKAGMPRKVDFTAFLDRLLGIVSVARRDVFLEMGRANTAHLIRRAEVAGGRLIRHWPITYYRRHPASLVQLRWQDQGLDPPDLAGMDDEFTPGAVLAACSLPGDVVMDPCMGRGLTAASTASQRGRTFIGLELSPWRMSCTLARLAALGCQVWREGTL